MTHQEYLEQIDRVICQGPYTDTWASLSEHPVPAWYRREKFGIFIHWGIYSVPAYGNEWYSRSMYDENNREFAYHQNTYGHQKNFGYKDFIPMFRGEHFDAQRWVDIFASAGARFVMSVAEHHDGFAMYDTQFNRWNAKNMGPCVDYLGELKKACEARGLQFCASTHRAEHYFFMNLGRSFDSDVCQEEYADFYGPAVYIPEYNSENMGPSSFNVLSPGPDERYLQDWMVRTCELIDRYQPSILYFDWWIHNQAFKPYLKKIAAYYYNCAHQWGREVTINYKHEAFAPGVGTFDVERGALTDISPIPWQTDTAIGKQSWGYRADNSYKSARQILCDLVDIVSKNGMLLLNVGPKADGTFAEEELQVLQKIGHWMQSNSEGIYDTVPWKRYGEGDVNNVAGFFQDSQEKAFTAQDFRFTYKQGNLYVFQLRPDGQSIHIRSLAFRKDQDFLIRQVQLLGSEQPLSHTRDQDGLHVQLPEGVCCDLPLCLRVQID